MADSDLNARLAKLEVLLGEPVAFVPIEETDLEDQDAGSESPPGFFKSWDAARAPSPPSATTVDPGDGASVGKQHVSSQSNLIFEPHGEPDVDCSACKVGEPMSEDIAYCPWNLVRSYPERFIGKTNKPLAKPFFDKITEGKVWDFFYLHNPADAKAKPFVLVPTAQFEHFLEAINMNLGIALTIPGSVHRDKFVMRFGTGGTPRPRYLKRTRDQKTLDVGTWPKIAESDMTAFATATSAERQRWMSNLKVLKTGYSGRSKDESAEHRAAKRKQAQEEALNLAQECLGLKGVQRDVVFVCMDVEAIELKPNPVSEVGIAILDTRTTREVQPGPSGCDWWSLFKNHHLRVKEYSGLVNYRYVKGCPDKFDFGISTFPNSSELPDAINAILKPYNDDNREIIFVGHDAKQDVNYLASIGFDVQRLPRFVRTLDTQAMHQRWKGSDSGRSLGSALADLYMDSKNLHNAGNDAVYTLRAMVALAVEAVRQEEALRTGEVYMPSLSASAT